MIAIRDRVRFVETDMMGVVLVEGRTRSLFTGHVASLEARRVG